jgi:exodeoxyribonuclease VII large subunit
MKERLFDLTDQLAQMQRDLQRASPMSMIERRHQQLDDTVERLQTWMGHVLALRQERFNGLVLRLHSLSPLLTIARGYAVVRHERDQAVISSVQQVRAHEYLTIQVQDGHIPVEVRTQIEG